MKTTDPDEIRKEFIVLPGSNPLSVKDLFEYQHVVVEQTKFGLKKTVPTNSIEENRQLEKLQADLKKQISVPRVDKSSARTIAEWDHEYKRIKVVKKTGKFQNFGYTEDKILYLTKYETLFLLELNRLELYFGSILVSIEQAYYLLFGADKNKYYDNYLIYSTLMRAGFVVKNHKNSDSQQIDIKDDDCIWEILLSNLNPNYEIPLYIQNNSKFNLIVNSMELIKDKTKSATFSTEAIPSNSKEFIDFDKKITGKRKHIEIDEQKFKRPRLQINSNQKSQSFLNDLMNEPKYNDFRKIFKKLELMILPNENEKSIVTNTDDQNGRDLEIVFDIYLPSKNSLKFSLPNLRVIALGSSECFPNRTELNRIYNRQHSKVPLIVIAIGTSKQIQAHIYFFT